MNLLFLGDVVGRSGRDAVMKHLPGLRERYKLDFIVINGDNAAAGFGITPAQCREFFAAGVDVITSGDHVWDQKELKPYLAQEKRLLRPLNFPPGTVGEGSGMFKTRSGKQVMVVHLLGQVFHKEHADCPFRLMDSLLASHKLGSGLNAILVDFHAEATSEKTAMGYHLDGRVSAVLGSHTHIPTSDARVLPRGTAYQTDCGMCGDYNSVIGFNPAQPIQRFLTKLPKIKLEVATGEATVSGAVIETDDASGLARSITPILLGGILG